MMDGPDCIVHVHIHRHIAVYIVNFLFNCAAILSAGIRSIIADTLERFGCKEKTISVLL